MAPPGMVKMSELSRRSGVSPGTIKHLLREGVLGGEDEVLRTSRNMAWYPEAFVERIALVRRLQEERYLPLRVIRELVADDPQAAARRLALEERILERALELGEGGGRVSRRDVAAAYSVPAAVLARLGRLGILSPNRRGYDPDDVAIIAAIARFRAGGYEQQLGFTVYDTLRYRDALQPLVAEEVATLLANLADVEDERALEIVAAGAEPLRELVGAMHSKLLLTELRRVRDRGRGRTRAGSPASRAQVTDDGEPVVSVTD